VKAGAVLPHFPVIQHTGEPVEQVTLHVYFSMHRYESYYYDDAGDGYEYKSGAYCLRKYTTFGNRRQFRIICETEGTYSGATQKFKLVIHGLPFSTRICEVDGIRVNVSPRQKGKLPELEAPVNFKKITFRSQVQKQ
jgi:alpha-glucosidase